MFIKDCEVNVNELYYQPIVGTVNFENELEYIPQAKEEGVEKFQEYMEGALEASGVKEQIKKSLKTLDTVKKQIDKDVIKGLKMYVEFIATDMERIHKIKTYADSLDKGFQKNKKEVSKYKGKLEKESKAITDELKSVNEGKEIKKIETELDEKYKEYSPKDRRKKK